MNIVLTNDDGISAPGLAVLEKIAAPLGNITVVAPSTPQSGVGHRVTVHAPLQLHRLAPARYSVDGSPADCVRLALKVLLPGDVSWVIAGINPGANLGSDIYQSGTVAAAREAAILGVAGMAVSQYISENGTVDWTATGDQAARVVAGIMDAPLPVHSYWNINLPHPIPQDSLVAHRMCDPDPNPHEYGYRRTGDVCTYEGSIHGRPRQPGKDVAVCFDEHCIAVSLLRL